MTVSTIARKYVLIGGLVILIAAAAFPSLYFYRQYQSVKSNASPDVSVDALVAKVGKHILLPTGETPTVMTVKDKEKLSGQLFFANGKNGDKVLIYEKAKKAFLYDPDSDKIIEVGPISVNSPTPSQASTPSAVPKIVL